ncbi:MAG: hypothetical protein CL780_04685 [Chloroflexi bacterium]|nr:hypothetical protein [Chloroflexota bacterium]|tara:strand:- start:5417 stop:5731 length:315 start_codon:yes stop_codon:yes gene_type:complete
MIYKRSPGVTYSITIIAEYPNIPEILGEITSVIGKSGGGARAVNVVETETNIMTRDFTISISDLGHLDVVVDSIKNVSKSAITIGVARRKKNIDEIYASFKPKR